MAEVNPRTYNGWHRGIGDASNSPVLELLVAGELTETYSRALHIAQASAANTDWNVAAAAHPTLFLHSTTTPATDYVRMDHDGTTADLDVVGGTTLSFQIDGTAEFTLATNVLTALSGSTIDFDAAAGAYASLIRDVNNNELLDTQGVASAVNQAAISNSATGNPVIVEARGGDTNIGIDLLAKGTGAVRTINTGEGLVIGTLSAFATTQGTNSLRMFAGTAPSGAITTSGALFATTVVRKLIADGTASNVET